MSIFSMAEAKSFLGALLLFFWGELREFDHVNVYDIRVFCHSRGWERLEGLSVPSTLLGDLLSSVPLVLEVSSFDIPHINLVWDSVKRHNPFHEWDGNSSSEEADENIVVCDASMANITLEGWDITLEWREELPILFGHMIGEKSGNGISRDVMVFKSCSKCGKKVTSHS